MSLLLYCPVELWWPLFVLERHQRNWITSSNGYGEIYREKGNGMKERKKKAARPFLRRTTIEYQGNSLFVVCDFKGHPRGTDRV